MIVRETIEIDGVEYLRTYSSEGMKIERDGARYDEAIDPIGSNRLYTETDEPIPVPEELAEPTEDFTEPGGDFIECEP